MQEWLVSYHELLASSGSSMPLTWSMPPYRGGNELPQEQSAWGSAASDWQAFWQASGDADLDLDILLSDLPISTNS